jgi:beta-galactosidase
MSTGNVSRREFLGAAVASAAYLPMLLGRAYPALAAVQSGGAFVPPRSPRSTFNFNYDWRFIREDVPGAEAPDFDDANWATISTPHSFNDIDSFRAIIGHSSGDRGIHQGLSWYRKHFKLPANLAGHRVFLEFEGMRQAGDIYLNGKQVGLYENGITAYGVDITDAHISVRKGMSLR